MTRNSHHVEEMKQSLFLDLCQWFEYDISENFHRSERMFLNNSVLEIGSSLIRHESVYTIKSLVFVGVILVVF